MWTEIFSSLPFAFIISVVIAIILYWCGGKIGVKGTKSPAKLSQYACGEYFMAEKLQVNVERFFVYAVYFLIFDILAFMLATSLLSPGLVPTLYALITLLAVILLIPLLRIKAG
ncbi:MAG: NADH-quinone oxidoreductase subunit A [Candidatus Bathyarchaeia archaeon]